MSAPEIIWLASWPRSGNTFVRVILWHCFGIRSGSLFDETATINAPDIRDQTGCSTDENDLNTRGIVFVKTHRADSDKLRAIYIIRDGREACVSSWRFLREVRDCPDCPMEEAIRGYDTAFGSWSEHAENWSPDTRPGTLLVRYEDMHANPRDVVTRIAEFIGVEPIKPNPPPFGHFHKLLPKFFRSGKTDTWREELTGDDLALFYELHGKAMERFGYGGGLAGQSFQGQKLVGVRETL